MKTKNILLSCICLLFGISKTTAQTEDIQIPSINEMKGDYIIVNYKTYEGITAIADVKSMRMDVTQDDSLKISDFYMKFCYDFKAGFNKNTGHISIPAGTKIFDYRDEQGSVQYLYAWNEELQEVISRPIVYKYKGNGHWHTDVPIVLMTGVIGGELSPYYFSVGSSIYLSNATTENETYVGYGEEQQKWEESRPSYVAVENNKVTIYNMLQTDALNYGCHITLVHDTNDNRLYTNPTLIGQVGDLEFPYKMLAGCEYDSEYNKPTGLCYAGTSTEGRIEGILDKDNGTIELKPMAIWPAMLDGSQIVMDTERFYEFEKTVKIKCEQLKATSIANLSTDKGTKEIVRIEYYNLAGQQLTKPQENTFIIQKNYYSDKTFDIHKTYYK